MYGWRRANRFGGCAAESRTHARKGGTLFVHGERGLDHLWLGVCDVQIADRAAHGIERGRWFNDGGFVSVWRA